MAIRVIIFGTSIGVREDGDLSCYHWSRPKLVPRTIYGSHSWSPRTTCGTADGPPRSTMAPWLVPFATAGLPYNPAFIAFLVNHSYIKNCVAFLVELKIAALALHACQCT